jgi:hypothetical protein
MHSSFSDENAIYLFERIGSAINTVSKNAQHVASWHKNAESGNATFWPSFDVINCPIDSKLSPFTLKH